MKSVNRLAKVIVSLRTKASLSQEELAEKAGLHRTYVSQLERGLKSPTLETLIRIATALGMRTSSLIRMTEEGSDEL